MSDSFLATRRGRWATVVGTMLVLSTFVVLLAFGLFGGYPPPCEDDLAFSGPQVSFSMAYDNATDELLVRHQQGETLRSESTDALLVVVAAGDSDTSTEYPLAAGSGAFPISSGDRLVLDTPTVAGRPLMAGDEISLVRRGSERPLPAVCPNSRSETTLNVTLGNHVVQ